MHSEKTTIGLRAERIAVRAALIMGLALATTTLAGRPAMAQEGQSALGMIVDEQDWEIGCDNLRACVALGMNPVEGQAGDYLRVTRDGDPNAAPVIELVIPRWRGQPARRPAGPDLGERQLSLSLRR